MEYTLKTQLNPQSIAEIIVKDNARSRLYRYTLQDASNWANTLPKEGDLIELANGQKYAYNSRLFATWKDPRTPLVYCLEFRKYIEKGQRFCSCRLSRDGRLPNYRTQLLIREKK